MKASRALTGYLARRKALENSQVHELGESPRGEAVLKFKKISLNPKDISRVRSEPVKRAEQAAFGSLHSSTRTIVIDSCPTSVNLQKHLFCFVLAVENIDANSILILSLPTAMALPVITSLEDCSSWARTVTPFIPQLYDLPQQLLQSWNDPTELQRIYLATNPLITAFAFSLFLVPIFLLISEINRNYSQVDRMWSILPMIYNAHYVAYAHMAGIESQRLDNLIAASTIWSLRLTFNYWRKGGYSIGSEDYRWEILRAKLPGSLFFVFNVLFISLAQSVLLFMVTTPAYVMLLAGTVGSKMGSADNFYTRGLILLVLLEFFADQQQWTYQEAKRLYQKTAKVPQGFRQADLDRGFVVTGLWSWSRHPNFAAEQSVWVAIYQWGCWTSDVLYNWTFIGALSYLILFQGSTWFTESITAGKYPEYKEYQQRVSMFLPKLSTDLPGDFSDKKASPKVEKPTAIAVKK